MATRALPVMTGSLYEIDAERGVLYVVVSAPLSVDGVREQVGVLLADDRFHPDLRGFINARFWIGPLPSIDDLNELAQVLRPVLLVPVRRRCAILVRTPELLDRARLFEHLTSDTFVHFRSFDDNREANAWLGLETGLEAWRRTPPVS